MKVRRVKPYVCVDCDYSDHARFQDTKDLDAAAGVWLRCLAYSRAQEQDGLVKASWLQRTFAATLDRIDDLIRVGLLRQREDGDYELHAYAPRNQTRGMLDVARERMTSARNAKASPKRNRLSAQAPSKQRGERFADAGGASLARPNARRSRSKKALSLALVGSSRPLVSDESGSDSEALASPSKGLTEQVTHKPGARVSISTSTSTSINSTSSSSSPSSSLGFSLAEDPEIQGRSGIHKGGPGGAPRERARSTLPASERGMSGALWLQAFTDGVTDHTRRPCTAGRMYLATLERLVTHHAPQRDAASACVWLRAEARAFAAKWAGKHPAKGLTPDGLERWLNDGRQGPPEFGRPRIVQPAAEDWHEDDWSDLGAEVMR